ncbi:unannotated protein [freshwater metagenome]|uniref:Unannotated protein n=1 Tax=freshwater metagenome TaxID=449393 RepID=A0A6J7IDC9_9ZZZZ
MSKTIQVAPGVHQVPLGFVNAYLIETDGELSIFDAGFAVDRDDIAAAIREIGYEPSDLKRVVMSHNHVDHSDGAIGLRELTGARLLLSKLDGDQAAKGLAGHSEMNVKEGFEELVASQMTDPEFAAKMGGFGPPPTPITAFEVDAHLEPGSAVEGLGDSLVIAAPGHCKGQVAVLLKRDGGILLTGDAAVNFGFIGIAPVAEDLALAQESFEALAQHDFEVACFGHGEALISGASASFKAAVEA